MIMKILIVEDDEDLLLTLTDLLESEGHSVLGFKRTKGVVNEIIKEHPDYALLDIKLPDGRGDKLAGDIKNTRNTNGVKIYLMSASEELTRIADESGADGYLKKPFGFQEVLNLLN